MKKEIYLIFALIVACFSSLPIKAQFTYYQSYRINNTQPYVSHVPVFDVTQRNLRKVILEDGVYDCIVECKSNSNNYAQYKVKVRFQDDYVTHIYFSNGGYVHCGRNNNGYTWRGGGIEWDVDYTGEITGGTIVIQLTYQNGRWQLFTINL